MEIFDKDEMQDNPRSSAVSRRDSFAPGAIAALMAFSIVFTGCSTHQKKFDEKTAPKTSYQVVNLGPAFEKFWAQAEGQPFSQQLQLWNALIEQPQQKLYDNVVWEKQLDPNWESRKETSLKQQFAKYPEYAKRIEKTFDEFRATLSTQIERFKKSFPDAEFAIPIYAVPSPNFNGRGAEGQETGFESPILAFGIDTAVERNDDPDVLYSHELFHIFHSTAMGIKEYKPGQNRLSLPLWMEGFATYVSFVANPSASRNSIFMDAALAGLSEDKIPALAKMFLEDVEQKDFDVENPAIYKRWFNMSDRYQLGGGYPARCGYLLGFKVVEVLGKKYSLSEMAHWQPIRVHIEVLRTLRTLANEVESIKGQVDVVKLTDHIYVVEDSFYFPENSAVYIGEKEVTVVSATWTPETAKLLVEKIRHITDKPITTVIDTHFHLDRTGGNPYFKKIGAQIVASKMTTDLMKKNWETRLKGAQKDYENFPSIPLVMPDVTFDNKYDLEDGKIQIRYFGPSHTADDVVVYFPKEEVLFGDCILKEKLGYLGDANLIEYPKTLERIKKLKIKTIIAGHWIPIHGPELIDQDLELLRLRASPEAHK